MQELLPACLDSRGCVTVSEHTFLERKQAAEKIADYILAHYEVELLWRTIKNHYFYFGEKDRQTIFRDALNTLYPIGEEVKCNIFYNRRKNLVMQKVLEYLEDTDILELDGFVHFRLYEYVAELSDVVAEAVDRLIAAKEYDEFIGLLKYFIDLQPHHEHLVHILPTEGGAFELYNEEMAEITNQNFQDFKKEVLSDSVNFSDFLISCLITLAPERIVIHKGDAIKNEELLRTISAVFGKKVSFCHSCPLCKL